MALLKFRSAAAAAPAAPAGDPAALEAFLQGYSIEVMPRTAEKVENFRDLLPEGTRVYIAHIEGTPIADMVATAKRLKGEGYDVMPHFPARIIKDAATLENWIAIYQGEADVKQALLLAGGVETPHGDFHSSMQLMETGLFDKAGFERLHVAGHPEGNRDIDPTGGDAVVMVQLTQRVGRDMLFVPFHFHDCVNRLTLGLLDPHSRQPAFKQNAVRVEKIDQKEAARFNLERRAF